MGTAREHKPNRKSRTGQRERDAEIRRNAHEARFAARQTRSAASQIKLLDAKLGVGVGAKKERLRLTSEQLRSAHTSFVSSIMQIQQTLQP